jgi:hypothetical protein
MFVMRLLTLVLMGSAWMAAETVRPVLRIPRVAAPPRIEEYLGGEAHPPGARVADFVQREPGDGTPASQATAAYLSYDDRNLYVVFVCQDEPEKVRARMSKREDFDSDDDVAVLLDTFLDRQRAYLFVSNPLGVQLDGVITEGQGRTGDADVGFDTLWHSEGRLTGSGFVVWMAIPFKSLRFSSDPVQRWGIALGRKIARNNEVSTWPHITQRQEGQVQQFATLEGLEQVSPGRNVQLIPYGSFARARYLDPQAPTFLTENDVRAGLDAKAVIRDAFTLDVSLNPDFSQVESDEPQVTVNQRFEVFFPEKRPFFIENAGFFDTAVGSWAFSEPSMKLYFSRRIADPEFGTRLTGKAGRWIVGGLVTDDRAPGKRVAPGDPLRGRRAVIGVGRVQREFGQQSRVGLLATSYDFGSSSNRVVSLDLRLKLNQNWVLSGEATRSYTREQNGAKLAGPAYFAQLARGGRHFSYTGTYADRSPDLRSQVGFVPRVDIRRMEHLVSYRWRPEGRRLVSFGPGTYFLANWDRKGRLQDWLSDSAFTAQFTGQSLLRLWWAEAYELYQNIGFRKRFPGAFFTTEWLKWISFQAQVERGTKLNYYPAAGRAPSRARTADAMAGFTLRPRPRFRFSQTYLYSRLANHLDAALPGLPADASIFNNHIFRSKVNYQFTRPLSLRAIIDYNAVLPNTALVALDRSKQVTADILLTYLLNPWTALYVGYTDRYENLNILPTMPPVLALTGSPDVSTGRQFFVKVNYLLRF